MENTLDKIIEALSTGDVEGFLLHTLGLGLVIIYNFWRTRVTNTKYTKTLFNVLNVLQKDVSNLIDVNKRNDFKEHLESEIDTMTNELVKKHLVQNRELKMLLDSISTNGAGVLKTILVNDFTHTSEELLTRFEIIARKINTNIVYNKLEVNKSFYDAVKDNVVYPSIRQFLEKYNEIKTLSNGVRRAALKEASLKLVDNIINNTIEEYKRSKNDNIKKDV